MHSNTNGIWIYTSLRALYASPFFDDEKYKIEKRISKLKRVVEKCKTYGIKVYIFAVEPMGLMPEEAVTRSDFFGIKHQILGRYPICLRTEKAKEYLINAVESIFREIPDLGGFIDITSGERTTSCPSVSSYRFCPMCSKFSRGENLAYAVDAIKEGIRRSGSDAKFISWTYGHRYWDYEDIEEYVKEVTSDVILMQNFEDGGFNEQLGKIRVACDYWLSYVGPSELYLNTADYAKKYNKEIWAKMQVCCSHEIATVPYIPVPGILYDKYMKARKNGTTGIMECWYFGNYPSIMSRAAGELSFLCEDVSKEEFLYNFAASIYGETNAGAVVRAWNLFEEGYLNYPTNIMFSYYGPMHDGVVWKLSLLPKNNPLPRSWKLADVPDGDRIGECLFAGHTLDESLVLCERMKDCWKKGVEALPFDDKNEIMTVSKAIGILFDSGYNILKFYKLRSLLGAECDDGGRIIFEMKKIVLSEIENSEKMIKLCNLDNRLGYHSEAEGFKFFPEKLEDRIDSLKELLREEFPKVECAITNGARPLGYYYGDGEDCINFGTDYVIGEGRAFTIDKTEDGVVLKITAKPGDNIGVYYEFSLFSPECGIVIKESDYKDISLETEVVAARGLCLDKDATSHQSIFGDGVTEELSLHKLSTERFDGKLIHMLYTKVDESKWNRKTAIKLRLSIGEDLLKKSNDPVETLGKGEFSPDEYCFVI